MQGNNQQRLSRMAAFSVAAFILCFALASTSHTAAAFSDKKAHNKGYRALRRGDFEQAEKIFRELLNKDAHDTEARLGLSFTQLKQRSLQAAYDNAARVIMQDPLSARAHALLGAAILGAGEFALSVEEFRTALTLNGDESLAVAGLAMVDFYENRMPSALAGLRKAVNMDPDEPDFVFNLGQAAARSEKYKEAADAYEKFLMIAPKT
ncbi:MAG TPA: tetratricopeptide repeat protein, partial [Pyrinomonadaceae bacterium]|nr:tetratricopeptide repeat protein [Pyrinomonadaceae bacterium]